MSARQRQVARLARAGVLAKRDSAREEQPGGERRRFEESKVSRRPGGSDQGGEFAPKGSGRGAASTRESDPLNRPAARERGERGVPGMRGEPAGEAPARKEPKPRPRREPPPPEPPKQPGYFEPARFGGTLGSALGNQIGWEIASRVLPGPLKAAPIAASLARRIAAAAAATPGRLKHLAARMAASAAGGVAGGYAGEEAGRATYPVGREPPGYEPPDAPLSEDLARFGGGMVGEQFISRLGGASLPGRIAVGTAGQLAGEEIAVAVHDIALRRFGPDAAARVQAATSRLSTRPPGAA